ncbi:hypothetical protein C2845_PM15G04690 [Panicum miliaceum]|uniref:Uncharacterized protein n=1 Tax=Panicum miliaceum TaxID=4540 RepID=A0A3L6Q9H9_PANMI|nr:hypothetical protein C2845_PM15G04690 [Panicum miliaceum]
MDEDKEQNNNLDLNLGQGNGQPNNEGWDAWPNQAPNDNPVVNEVDPDVMGHNVAMQNNVADNLVQPIMPEEIQVEELFSWAKELLSSQAREIITSTSSNGVHFALPDKCPKAVLECQSNLPDPVALSSMNVPCDTDSPAKSKSPDKKGKGPTSPASFSPETPLE